MRVRIEIKRSLVPSDLWHWCVVFENGHIFSMSKNSFKTIELCMDDASKVGIEDVKLAEKQLKLIC